MIIEVLERSKIENEVKLRSCHYKTNENDLVKALWDYANNFNSNNVVRYEGCCIDLDVEIISAKILEVANNEPEVDCIVTVKDIIDIMPDYWQSHYSKFNYSKNDLLEVEKYSICDLLCEWGYELIDDMVDGDFENLENYYTLKVREMKK